MNINIKYREDFDKIYEEIEKVEIAVELVNGKWQTSKKLHCQS